MVVPAEAIDHSVAAEVVVEILDADGDDDTEAVGEIPAAAADDAEAVVEAAA